MQPDRETALIVVDVQNDFADPAGSLYVAGGDEAMGYINKQISTAQTAGSFVVYTQDWHPETTPHFAKDGGIWPVHCVADTWGAGFFPALKVTGPVIRKGVSGEDGYSGLSVRHPETGKETETELRSILNERGITTIVIVGLATDYCVKETAIESAGNGFRTTILADGIRAVNLEPGNGARAIAAMTGAGVSIA